MTTQHIHFDPLAAAFVTRGAILITGEPGAGKTWRARDLAREHAPHKRIVTLDCGATHGETLKATLFGHTREAYSGARRDRGGVFEEAHGGVLILDEIGEVPLPMQSSLLRVLQSGIVQRMGESREREVDVMVIACTNRDLQAEVAGGNFRADLYSRLTMLGHLYIAPLRDRADEVPRIVRGLVADLAERLAVPPVEVSDEAAMVLASYDWPYNVRSLEGAVRGLLALGEASVAAAHAVARALLGLSGETEAVVLPESDDLATGRDREPLAIVELLGDRGREFTRAEYEEVAGVSYATACRDLSSLIDCGVVAMVSGGRTARYALSSHETKESPHETKESPHETNADSEEVAR